MKKRVIILVLLIMLLLILGSYLNAQEEDVTGFFVSGNKYIKFSEEARMLYVVGNNDMYIIMLNFLSPERYKIFKEKTNDMTIEQITKIFDRYLEENPEMLHEPASLCFLSAMAEIIDE